MTSGLIVGAPESHVLNLLYGLVSIGVSLVKEVLDGLSLIPHSLQMLLLYCGMRRDGLTATPKSYALCSQYFLTLLMHTAGRILQII